MTDPNNHDDVFQYGDPGIASAHGKVPRWLIWTYITLPLWGILWAYLFWNGSYGWFDRGYWKQLQVAANTTFPERNDER